jgi:hypothetical protein
LYVRGTFTAPIPGQLKLSDVGSIARTAFASTIGEAGFSGAVQVPGLTLVDVSGRLKLSEQIVRLNASIRAMNLARLDLSATGYLSETGANVSGSARLTLFGIPSLRGQVAGNIDYSGAYYISGTASGYIPPLTYAFGSFSANSKKGLSAQAHILGLAFVPSLSDMPDPSPLSVPLRTFLSLPESDPSVPTGVSLGYSFFKYSRGRATTFGIGLIPSYKKGLQLGTTLSVPF